MTVADAARREERLPAGVLAAGLRSHVARGTIINAAFQVGLALLVFVRRIVVAVFLTPAEFGLWGALLGVLLFVVFIKSVGIGDKFVQQSDPDQERAFQKMLTIDLILAVATIALAAVCLPVFALAYGKPEIIFPGLVLSLALLGNSLQAPSVIFYRRMDFVRQRVLQAVDPCVALVLTIALAVAGAGYWSLVLGAVSGAFAGAVACLLACPYPIRLHLERTTTGEYFSFSWPLAVARGSGVAVGNVTMLVATRTMGFAQAGAIGLANAITGFTDGVDAIVTQTLYPAICAVRERADLLYEAFVKSNRLAMMWGMPFGFGLALFAGDLVHFGFGDQWKPAIPVIEAFGVVAAIDQVAFNWTAFMRALNRTRPLAALALLNLGAFTVTTLPLLIAFGLKGFAVGVLIAQAVNLAGRTYYLGKLFEGFGIIGHALRAMAPAAAGVAAVLAVRGLAPAEPRSLVRAIAELALFTGVSLVATVVLERALLREVLGYVRARATAP